MNPAILMLVGAGLIGTAPIFVNLTTVAPTVAAFWRVAFGGLLLLLWIYRPSGKLERISWRAQFWLILAAIFFALDLWFWHRSIRYLGPGLATLLANFQVFCMGAAGVIFYREHLGWRFGVGLLLALLGMWLLVGKDWQLLDEKAHAGVWLGFATALVYAGYLLSLRVAQRMKGGPRPETSVFWVCLWTAPMFLAMTASEGNSIAIPNWRETIILLAYGAIAQVAGWLFIARAMPNLKASSVGLLLLAQPTVAYVLDAMVFHHQLSHFDLIGIGCSLCGIFLGGVRR